MVKFTTTLLRFGKMGEKTGWTYILFPSRIAEKLKDSKVSFRVKGMLDSHPIKGVALIPMGQGDFILPFNSAMRKATGKTHGEKLKVEVELDEAVRVLSPDLMKCLKPEPQALKYFKSLPPSHQYYFSKWIESAKTASTKTKRLAITIIAMANKQNYGEMLRAYRTYEL